VTNILNWANEQYDLDGRGNRHSESFKSLSELHLSAAFNTWIDHKRVLQKLNIGNSIFNEIT
jgi:hypothetical protein